nr:hypothetical protein HUO10_004809 [Paraburkholderia busanensis]
MRTNDTQSSNAAQVQLRNAQDGESFELRDVGKDKGKGKALDESGKQPMLSGLATLTQNRAQTNAASSSSTGGGLEGAKQFKVARKPVPSLQQTAPTVDTARTDGSAKLARLAEPPRDPALALQGRSNGNALNDGTSGNPPPAFKVPRKPVPGASTSGASGTSRTNAVASGSGRQPVSNATTTVPATATDTVRHVRFEEIQTAPGGVPPTGGHPPVVAQNPPPPPRPHGEALGRIVPEVSTFGKGLRKIGRWTRTDNDTALINLTNKTKPANGAISGLVGGKVPGVQSAYIASATHETVNTALAAHATATAYSRESRYRNNLKDPAARGDLSGVNVAPRLNLEQVAERKDFESRHQLVNAIISHDADNDPNGHRDKMRDVLVGRYIADVHGGTRLRSNLYSGAMSVVGMGATAALTAGTHGIAPAAIAGGALLSGRDVLNNRGAAVSLKQHYRDKKEARIADVTTQRLLRRGGAADEQAWADQAMLARHEVNQQNISRFVPIGFSRINDKKSTAHKKEETDLVKKRATELVMGAIKETDQDDLKRVFTAYSSSETTSKRSLENFYHDAGGLNPDLKKACQLMRDLGMSKTESLAYLRSTVGGHLAQTASADVLEGMGKSRQPIMRTLALKPEDNLESAIGSAMKRR